MNLSDRVQQNPETPTRDIEGFVHVIDPAKGMLHTFNEAGTRIWSLLEQPTSVSSVVEVLAGEYDAEAAQLETDVVQFLDSLLEQGLVVTAD